MKSFELQIKSTNVIVSKFLKIDHEARPEGNRSHLEKKVVEYRESNIRKCLHRFQAKRQNFDNQL